MRNLRLFYVCGALSLAGNLVGCNTPLQGNCPKPAGLYRAQYSLIAGTCTGGYEPFALVFSRDDPPNTTRTEQRLADVVITEVTLKGCELKVGQRVTGEGAVSGRAQTRSAIAGTLGVVDDTNLSGTIERTDFMEDGQTVRCSAQYDAWYSRDDLLLGAAARD
jgi:hypothetical protein